MKVSILTPSLGYGRYIADALASVREQRVDAELEHIVTDGGSTDSTADVLTSAPSRPGYRLTWRSEADNGQSDALNSALAMSSGEIIGWLNADEFYLPGAIANAVELLGSGDCDVVYGEAYFVDADGRFLRHRSQHGYSERVLRWYGCYISSCAFFVRRENLGESPWDPRLRTIMDWDLFLRLAAGGARFRYIPRALGAFRVHDLRVTAEPLPAGDAQRQLVHQRWNLPTRPTHRRFTRVASRLERVGRKALNGGYVRELASAWSSRGQPLSWWSESRY